MRTDIVNMMRRRRFSNDWTLKQLEQARERFREISTIPVNTEIKGNSLVLNLDEAKNILVDARRIVLMDCTCRVQRGNCEAPRNTCLRLNERAKQALEIEELKKLNPREVTVEEALRTLHESHKYGLIHLAIAVEQNEVNEVCSCCPCCCLALSTSIRYGLAPKLLTSKTVAYTEKSKCVTCGICVKRCLLGSREIIDNSLLTDSTRCIGCGLCVTTCPTQAISLIKKS
jgi:Pyruvate/2-oxoacid:ferredoxin oxidoreductase delta subunit